MTTTFTKRDEIRILDGERGHEHEYHCKEHYGKEKSAADDTA